MDTAELIEHLRVAHGYAEQEPGGPGHEPGVSGLTHSLDDIGDDVRQALHESDHAEYPGVGTPVDGQAHAHGCGRQREGEA